MPTQEVVHYEVGADGYRDVANYDRRRYQGPANEYRFAVMSAAYHHLLGPLQGKRVLDVGCGTGRGLAEFVNEARSVTGCDASFDMLRFARQKIAGNRASYVRSLAQDLPLVSNTFDVVTALNFLHLFQIESQRQMVSEMKRVLKPGGILLLEFDNGLQGGFVGLVKRISGRERCALMPWEIRRVIGPGVRVTGIHGACFPIVWRAMYRFPRVSSRIEKLSYFAPLNRFTSRIYYKAVKE
jgi:ubiquinone/menaquinone biosynthesis C-methylase UbiE